MLQLADGEERRGALMGAARVLAAASLPGRHGLLSAALEGEATQRALRLLETKLDGDGAANELELDLLARVLSLAGGGSHTLERTQVLQQRRAAARGVQADSTDLVVEAGQAAMSQFFAGVLKGLKLQGFGTAEDAKSPPTASEFAEAAAATLAATRARVCGETRRAALAGSLAPWLPGRCTLAPRRCEDSPPHPCAMVVSGAACRRSGCR